MRNQSTTLVEHYAHSLKVAHSYLTPKKEKDLYSARNTQVALSKTSPHESLYIVHPKVQEVINWDADWFGNYE